MQGQIEGCFNLKEVMIKEEALAHGSNFPKISHLCLYFFFSPSVSVPAVSLPSFLEFPRAKFRNQSLPPLTFPEYFSSIPNLRLVLVLREEEGGRGRILEKVI